MIKHWDDLSLGMGITVRWDKRDSSWFQGTVYEIVQTNMDGSNPGYARRGAVSSLDCTEDLADAEPLISFVIKWDGCSHFTFGSDDGYIHICGEDYAEGLIEVMRRLFADARDNMEGWDDDVAGHARAAKMRSRESS